MDRTQLLEHFDTLAETPDAVAKLRELVLQLAIRGQLLSQDTRDSSAPRVVDATRKLADTDLPEIDSDDTPFDLPKGWAWLRIGEAMRLFNGRAFKPSDWGTTGLPIVRIQNLNKPGAVFNYCDFEVDKKVLIKNDDLLISWSGTPGTSFGAFIWNRGPAVLNQHIFRAELIGDAYDKRFLRLGINGRLDEMISKAHGAVGLQHITKGKLELMVLPVPPLAEQRRIVAKVEELLALCDELEVRQTAAREHRTRLVRSALDHLTAGVCPSPGAATSARTRASESSSALRPHHAAAPEDGRTPDHFPRHTAFVLNTFPDLAAAPEDVPALRQAILSLAVQGRLVSRDTKKPIQDLVMEDLVGQKNLKNGLSLRQTAGAAKYSCLPISAMRDGLIRCSDRKPVILTEERAKPYLIKANDVFIVRGNGSTHLVGRAGIVEGNPTDLIFPDLFIRVPLDGTRLDARYFVLAWNSPEMRRRIESIAKTTAGILKINQGHIAALSLPVPPLSEQQRIVAKVDELLRWCDALEARLTAAQTTAVHLLDATLHQILASA